MNKKQAISILESALSKPFSDEVDAALCYLAMLEMPSKRFRPPTVEEVAEYCENRQNGIDAELFVSHYQANGWIRGKTPMKDWKSAITTWEKSRTGHGGTHQQDTRSRAKRVADRFDEIGRASLERERALGSGNSQTVPGPISPPLDFGD